jgi:hypothetical protein
LLIPQPFLAKNNITEKKTKRYTLPFPLFNCQGRILDLYSPEEKSALCYLEDFKLYFKLWGDLLNMNENTVDTD